MFYMGFLSLYSAPVTPETIENNGAFGDFEKLLNAHKIGRAKKEMKLPNYLAIFVPRDENDANSPIVPELERLLPNKRYTSRRVCVRAWGIDEPPEPRSRKN